MQYRLVRPCQGKCVNGYVHISRLEPVCQIVWQIDHGTQFLQTEERKYDKVGA